MNSRHESVTEFLGDRSDNAGIDDRRTHPGRIRIDEPDNFNAELVAVIVEFLCQRHLAVDGGAHDLDVGIRGQDVGHDLPDDDRVIDDHHPDRVHA